MKENKKEVESATSIIQRLIESRCLTEEQYMNLNKSRHKTAENRRMNEFYDKESEGRIQSNIKKG